MKVKVLDSSSTNLVSMEFIELSVNQRPDYDDENNIPKIIIFLLENLIHLSFNVVDSARCNPMLDFKSSTEPPPCYYIKQHSIEVRCAYTGIVRHETVSDLMNYLVCTSQMIGRRNNDEEEENQEQQTQYFTGDDDINEFKGIYYQIFY
ncbi:18364_t:CDS:2 [Entrophospora sp. SA101]|nr:18364_t:CDS:2 [Entrophospora sp. SA101]CAJ0834998.1 4772_t:CDS:2 [Entrophospora sp. SA101]